MHSPPPTPSAAARATRSAQRSIVRRAPGQAWLERSREGRRKQGGRRYRDRQASSTLGYAALEMHREAGFPLDYRSSAYAYVERPNSVLVELLEHHVLSERPSARILDIGCGAGANA